MSILFFHSIYLITKQNQNFPELQVKSLCGILFRKCHIPRHPFFKDILYTSLNFIFSFHIPYYQTKSKLPLKLQVKSLCGILLENVIYRDIHFLKIFYIRVSILFFHSIYLLTEQNQNFPGATSEISLRDTFRKYHVLRPTLGRLWYFLKIFYIWSQFDSFIPYTFSPNKIKTFLELQVKSLCGILLENVIHRDISKKHSLNGSHLVSFIPYSFLPKCVTVTVSLSKSIGI